MHLRAPWPIQWYPFWYRNSRYWYQFTTIKVQSWWLVMGWFGWNCWTQVCRQLSQYRLSEANYNMVTLDTYRTCAKSEACESKAQIRCRYNPVFNKSRGFVRYKRLQYIARVKTNLVAFPTLPLTIHLGKTFGTMVHRRLVEFLNNVVVAVHKRTIEARLLDAILMWDDKWRTPKGHVSPVLSETKVPVPSPNWVQFHCDIRPALLKQTKLRSDMRTISFLLTPDPIGNSITYDKSHVVSIYIPSRIKYHTGATRKGRSVCILSYE